MAKQPSLQGDYGNVALLLLLYFLQGIPMGLAGSIPLFLQTKGATMTDQAKFQFVSWPYSLKILWAPLVDALYFRSMGKRKSWIVPVQFVTGIVMIAAGSVVAALVEGEGSIDPTTGSLKGLPVLVGTFFSLFALVATQDIAVDGWAIEILKEENLQWASTCNTVGQTAGYMTSYALFMALNSADFCNGYLRGPMGYAAQDVGAVTFKGFMHFWGGAFIVVTLAVWILKKEKTRAEPEDATGKAKPNAWRDVRAAYSEILQVLKLPVIWKLLLVLVTVRLAFGPTDSSTALRLIAAGVPKDQLGLLGVVYVPLEIVFPFIINRVISGSRSPLSVFTGAFPVRLVCGVLLALVISQAPMLAPGAVPPVWFYGLVVFVLVFHRLSCNAMFVSQMAFFAQVSDPRIGGSYMTLLNTAANLGGAWPGPLALWSIGQLDVRQCSKAGSVLTDMTCAGSKAACIEAGGSCELIRDGYLWMVVCSAIVGMVWYFASAGIMRGLDRTPISAWRVSQDTDTEEEGENLLQ